MNNQNKGVIIRGPKIGDYILGKNSKISSDRNIPDQSIYLPDFETQRNKITDMMDCVTFSAIHDIEMGLNYLYKNGLMWDEAVNFFTNNHYIQNGKIRLSPRFNAKMSGTTIEGNDQGTVAEHIRTIDGVVPEVLWPMGEGMNWQQYYSDVPDNIISLGKQSLFYINSQYQWVGQIDIPSLLPVAPVQVASEVCAGWDSGEIVPKCSGQPIQHATIIYGIDPSGNYLNLDNYSPYLQKLSPDYELPYCMQFIVAMKPIVLRIGMKGSNVAKLQQKLGIKSDGIFGNVTSRFVKNYQLANKLKVDGAVGPLTLKSLNLIL